MSTGSQYVCFDFGVKRFGVATGNSLLRQGQELSPIMAQDGIPDWRCIESLVDEWKPDGFVVGLPLNMDGSESEMSTRARKFGKRLKGRFNKPVYMVDERLSSYDAKTRAQERSSRKLDFGQFSVDGQAACLILETWFATQEQHNESSA